MTLERLIAQLLLADKRRAKALEVVRREMPHAYLSAGFVRNAVWDHLHGKAPTPLNDIDVIYFESSEPDKQRQYELALSAALPGANWQVRNQAYMHTRNGDSPYHSLVDAMAHWPEEETAVAVRLRDKGQIEYLSAFGLESLVSGAITHNPARARSVFLDRVNKKGWLKRWPNLNLSI